MRLMTYNIFNGGEERLPLIIEVIKREKPDYVTLNESNTFAANNNEILKRVASAVNLPYCDLALSGQYDYHVAVLSKYPLKEVSKLQPLMRACLITRIDSELGSISIASLHLTPDTEDLRHPEIDLIVNSQRAYQNRILMGDMNSLAKHDNYPPQVIEIFNDTQLKKFTTDSKLRFDAIDKIISSGYHDSAQHLGKNEESTIPTEINQDPAHNTKLRLDYIFVSKPLLPHLADYSVIKNGLTNKASDHHPVVITLE